MLLCSVPLIYLGWKVFWAVPSWCVVVNAKALQQPSYMGTWYGMDLARGILSIEWTEMRQHSSGHCCNSVSDSILGGFLLQSCGLCCNNQGPDTHNTAYQSLKEKLGMRMYCGSEATSHRIAHATELLHYGPAFPQAHHHGLDGIQAHVRQWAEDTVRFLGRAY